MALKPRTVRVSDDLWAAAGIAAKHRGESIGEYIRTALASRCAYDMGARKDEVGEKFGRLWPAAAEAGKDLRDVYDLDDE